MNDAAVRQLSRDAGIAVQWTDHAGKRRRVAVDTLRRILAALGLPSDSANDRSHSRHLLAQERVPPLMTATAAAPIYLPIKMTGHSRRAHIVHEDGTASELTVAQTRNGVSVPPIQSIGYHTLEIDRTRITLAVAPPRCMTIADIVAPNARIAGLAAQIYGLRSQSDCGIGDLAGVTALAQAAATRQIDALALSPAHALFMADHGHFSPYSPSSRLFYNPLLADAGSVLEKARTDRARAAVAMALPLQELEASALIDWRRSGQAKLAVLRNLFDDFTSTDLAHQGSELAADFATFRAVRGDALERHALFEALHAALLQADPRAWSWRDWPTRWRDPHGTAVKGFAQNNKHEVLFHTFLQWIAHRSFAVAQQQARHAGMRIGLIADMAVGISHSGSDAWSGGDDILGDLEIGAPPDLFNLNGQNWGLTTFSPRALQNRGFAPFIDTLRACIQHAGGVRVDHVMGLMRLWVTPRGAASNEGSYLAYPLDDLLRLTALESYRHRAIVIGEDLGTVPSGFRSRMAQVGIYGTSVLWFERDGPSFVRPTAWPAEAVAMTSTHDLPTVAGWWRATDLKVRAQCGLLRDTARERTARNRQRKALWRAFLSARVTGGNMPSPAASSRVANAAARFVAATPSQLTLLPLEDALAATSQPNLPGTIDAHPNWRRRYPGKSGTLLDSPAVRRRVHSLAKRETP
jgi:4-alpha-glucanotransferase